jgi:hypothetical protein
MAYSKAKLKSSGDKASPCFRPFWIENYESLFIPDCHIYRTDCFPSRDAGTTFAVRKSIPHNNVDLFN